MTSRAQLYGIALLATIALCLHSLAGQSAAGTKPAAPAATQPPPVLLRSTTRLVQVSVVVHNRKGEPVSDLKKEDFAVTEKGKPQQISVFSVTSTERLSTPAVKLPSNIFSNRIDQRSGVPNSVTVILLDSLNTQWSDQVYAKQQVIKFLQQIQPEDRVAIYTLGRGLTILHDYTTDSTALLNALARYNGQNIPDLAASEPQTDQLSADDQLGIGALFDTHVESDFFTTSRVLNTLKALEVIANHLSSLPGRKNLIWVSGGFPLSIGMDEIPSIDSPVREQRAFFDETEATIRALNNASIAVYPVDARGLVVGGNFSAAVRGSVSRIPPPVSLKPTVPNLDTMEELASRTGGRAAYNTNDLKNAVRKAMEDAKVTYTLGYYPSEVSLDGRFHDIKVKVDRPGLNVRYRKGYFALAEASQDDKTRKAEMRNAVWSPLDATAVAVNARVDLLNKPQPNTLNVFVQVDPVNLTLTQNGDRWTGTVDLVFVQKDEHGKDFGTGLADTINLNLTKDTYLRMLKTGIIYQRQFPREERAKTLRIVARDTPSGSVGSLSIPLNQVKLVTPAPLAPAQKSPDPVNPGK